MAPPKYFPEGADAVPSGANNGNDTELDVSKPVHSDFTVSLANCTSTNLRNSSSLCNSMLNGSPVASTLLKVTSSRVFVLRFLYTLGLFLDASGSGGLMIATRSILV